MTQTIDDTFTKETIHLIEDGLPWGMVAVSKELWESETVFQNQLRELIGERKDILFTTIDELTFGTRNGRRYMELPEGLRIYEDENIPRWAMIRSISNHDFFIEQMGIPCFPSHKTREIFDDKSYTYSMLSGIVPMPDAVYMTPYADKAKVERCFDEYPCIIKSALGQHGTNVHRAEVPEDVSGCIDEIDNKRSVVFQRACPTGDDLRVYVMDRKIRGAVLRRTGEGSWKANSSYLGKREAMELNDKQREYIENVMELFPEEKGFVSIDFLTDDNDELTLCECNINPGIGSLAKTGGAEGFVKEYIEAIERAVSA